MDSVALTQALKVIIVSEEVLIVLSGPSSYFGDFYWWCNEKLLHGISQASSLDAGYWAQVNRGSKFYYQDCHVSL